MGTFVLATINARNRLKPLRVMKKKRRGRTPDVICPQEVYKRLTWLGNRREYRMFFGSGARDRSRGAKNNPVLTKKKFPMMGVMALLTTDDATHMKWAPDRFLTVSIFDPGVGPTAIINVYAHAILSTRSYDLDQVREAQAMVNTLDRLIGFLEEEGYHVIVAGDINFPKSGRTDDWRDMYEMFGYQNMIVHSKGDDAVAHSQGLKALEVIVVSKKQTGSDHPGIWILFSD